MTNDCPHFSPETGGICAVCEIDRLTNERDKYKAALTAIIIHGQYPGYDNNWAVYVLDLAREALK